MWKSRSKNDLLLIKVDFEKAYDSVDWRFLGDVMIKMNFPLVWRKCILVCLTTASTSVLVNGSSTNEFAWEEGVGEGVCGSTVSCYVAGWCDWQVNLKASFFPSIQVKSAYNLLTTFEVGVDDRFSHILWLKQIPLKVNIFIWRLFLNRLATKWICLGVTFWLQLFFVYGYLLHDGGSRPFVFYLCFS